MGVEKFLGPRDIVMSYPDTLFWRFEQEQLPKAHMCECVVSSWWTSF